jgi:hypothetical protein
MGPHTLGVTQYQKKEGIMYSPDTLQRLNDEAVAKYLVQTEAGERTCDYCNEPAVTSIPVYNPADEVRDVKGAYAMINVCAEHYERGDYLEDTFYCAGCDQLFVTHHSWDVLYVERNGEMFCQRCALESFEGIELWELLEHLRRGNTKDFMRANSFPGKEELVDLEFSEWSDFPGCTTLQQVAQKIEDAAGEAGLTQETVVYPLMTHGYQFSVVLGIYY